MIIPADLTVILSSYKKSGDYLCDGLVIEVNEYKTRKKIGHHPNGNPKFGIAFKEQFVEDQKWSSVTSINWRTSKNGHIIPEVSYRPVELMGTTCKRVSGKNAKFIKDKKITLGSRIKIQKSGDIIPDIIKVDNSNAMPKIGFEYVPTRCPSCGSRTRWNDTNVHICCTNNSCSAQLIRSLTSFLKIIGVENISEATAEKIINKHNLTDISALFRLNEEDYITEGIGKKSADKFYHSIHNSLKNVNLAKLMHATNMFVPLGSTKLQWIIDKFGKNTLNKKFSIIDISEIKGFDEKTAKIFVQNIEKFKKWYEDNRHYITYTIISKTKTSGKLQNNKFVFSGFRDKTLEKNILDLGGEISSSISSKISYLVVNDLNKSSGKIEKAKKLGINIIDKNQLIKLLTKSGEKNE